MEVVPSAYTRLPHHKESLKMTASALPKNLAVLQSGEKRSFATAHKSRVCILTRDGPQSTIQRVLEPFPSDAEGELDSRTFVTEVHSGRYCREVLDRTPLPPSLPPSPPGEVVSPAFRAGSACGHIICWFHGL